MSTQTHHSTYFTKASPSPLAKCSRCGGAIRWERTAKNHKWVPLNPFPTFSESKGNFVLREHLAHYVRNDERGEHKHVYESHFATCEKAQG